MSPTDSETILPPTSALAYAPPSWFGALDCKGRQASHSMSALGQKQTLERASAMSALPPKADILRGGLYVR